MHTILSRYTELPFLLEYLRTKELALLSPLSWDDKNDAFYLDAYARAKGLASVCVLCLTEAQETYHHWRVFSSGFSGMCIVFRKDRLLEWVGTHPQLHAGPVVYKTLPDMRAEGPSLEALPFLKRQAFADEKEFRVFGVPPPTVDNGPLRAPIPLSTIDRIVINPWLPKSVAEHVKATIKELDGCKGLKVYRSTLVDNEAWKKFASTG
jgi:hypothetical protein